MKLVGSNEIDWNPSSAVPGFTPETVFFGQGSAAQAMQIATGSASSAPSRSHLKALYADRKGKLPISLMIAVDHGEQITIFGPDPDFETLTLRTGNAINFLNAVLSEPEESLSYQKAISIRRSLQTTNILGFTNNGLFASHYIRTSGPAHPSWSKCLEESKNLVDLRNKQLIAGLGFEITSSPANTHVLRAKGQDKRVVAVLLDQNESFDGKSARFQSSPVEWGLNMASNEGAPWLIAIRDSQIRLYPAKDGVGVGQKSQVETYFEIDLLTIDEEKSAFLPLVFSAEALSEGGTADELLRESKKFAAALGTRLRERVYESIVPQLATEIANQLRDKGHKLDTEGLQLAYGLTLRVLFRLLFQAYAEDRGLLPAGRNERFDKNSLKGRADDLIKHGPDFEFGDASTIWLDCMQIWNAIDQGSPEMQIPAYNGGLFGTDETLHPEGFLIGSLRVPDRVMGPALRALVIDDTTEDGVPGMVDFRSLSVREFGTIYEGLLESSLSVAEQDLTVDKKGAWVPASKGETVLAKAGEVYFHSASGERKATGSYYTPSFVVDHLIERSVEPALKNHLAKVKEKILAGDQAAAYDLFFDFRVADLAMGSGHFLVAAIDKIETVMRAFLLEPGNQIEGVEAELKRLEDAAKNSLGVDEAAYAEIERASLLRRQIARRCIYGLDINPLAVDLSRLAIWIHTFVPGLPMSSLEHGLVCGNSLTGVGSLEEAMQALLPKKAKRGEPRVADLLEWAVEDSLNAAKALLSDSANADEANKAEVKLARERAREAKVASSKAKAIFDIAIGNRNEVVDAGQKVVEEDLLELQGSEDLIEFLQAVVPAHMPFLFPEVFLRPNPGFDALVGNPPWEKVKLEDQIWWGRYLPGLRGKEMKERQGELAAFQKSRPDLEVEFKRDLEDAALLRSALLCGPYPGLGSGGDPDLYQAFAWRYLQLIRDSGIFSIVLPRGALSGPSMSEWRKSVIESFQFADVVFAGNTGGWLFPGVDGRYTVAMCSVKKQAGSDVQFAGPVASLRELRETKFTREIVPSAQFLGWSSTAAFPLLDDSRSALVFKKMSEFLPFGATRKDIDFRLTYELHSSADKHKFNVDLDHPAGPIPVLKGASIGLWNPTFGPPYAYAKEQLMRDALGDRATSGVSQARSAYFGAERFMSVNPLDEPKILFRSITNRTNSRTVLCSLVPAGVTSTDSAPAIVRGNSSEFEEAYLLAVMSSRVFDWLARRWVELKLTFDVLRRLPIPTFNSLDQNCVALAALSATLLKDEKELSDWTSRVFNLSKSNPVEGTTESLLAELDARVGKLYGLSAEDLQTIYSTFHKGWDHSNDLALTLDIYKELPK